jgi:CRP-like cAMP-binding protein
MFRKADQIMVIARPAPPIHVPGAPEPTNHLLAELPRDEYERIRPHLYPTAMTFRKILHREDETIRDVYFPGSGACSITRTTNDGGIAEITTIGVEGVIGGGVLFGDSQSPGDAVVQIPGGVGFRMPVDQFLIETERRGAFHDRTMRFMQVMTRQLMQTVVCNALHTAEQRCCRWLLMSQDRAKRTDLHLTHEFLAVMLGVRRPTITLVVGALQAAGLISTQRGMITIANREGLEAASCDCYATMQAYTLRMSSMRPPTLPPRV